MPTPARRLLAAPALLAAAALAVLLAARSAPPPAVAGRVAPVAVLDPGDQWHTSPWGQLVFFAVLEGLYADGVQQQVVRAVLSGPPDDPSAGGGATDAATDLATLPPDEWWRRHLETTLFVPACPLCTPALVAFETYAARGPLHAKGIQADGRPLDTFGPGLSDALVARLTDPRRAVRLAALQELVTTWIERRLDFGRATTAERDELRRWMEDGRKAGMNQLGALRQALDPAAAASWPRCATCDASVEACSR